MITESGFDAEPKSSKKYTEHLSAGGDLQLPPCGNGCLLKNALQVNKKKRSHHKWAASLVKFIENYRSCAEECQFPAEVLSGGVSHLSLKKSIPIFRYFGRY